MALNYLRLVPQALLGCAVAMLITGCEKKSPAEPSPNTTPGTSSTCSFTVGNPPAAALLSAGDEFTVTVSTSAGCEWSATSDVEFITPVLPASGSGSGSARFAVLPNEAGAREGTVQVAGRSLTVRQQSSQPCEFGVTPSSATVGIPGGDISLSVGVTKGEDCSWTATSNSAFLTVKSGASGSGEGTTVLSVAANPGAARVASATVAGRTINILQDGTVPPVPCAFTVSPTSVSMTDAGGNAVVVITKTQGTACPWIASSRNAFATIVGGSSGVDSGSVTVVVGANPGPVQRVATLDIAGRTVSIIQAGPVACAFTVSPTGAAVIAGGGSQIFTITNTQGSNCSWSAQSHAAFLTITGNNSGVGSGSLTVVTAANSGAARSGTVTIAGVAVTINQAGTSSGSGPAAVFSFVSDLGDYIGAGQTQSYVLTGSEFTFGGTGSGYEFRMTGGSGWTLNLSSPTGIVPGLYDRAERWPFQSSGRPGLSFSGEGRGCNKLTGRFVVGQAVFNGNVVQRLHVRFEQHCEGWSVAARGELWIDAGGSTTPPPLAFPPSPATPSTFFSYQSEPGDVVGNGGSGSFSLAVAKFLGWTAPGGPAVNLFVQSPAGAGFHWNLSFSAPSGTGSQLTPGTYNNATRYPFQAAGIPGISVFSGTGCNTVTGSFIVLEAVYGAQGDVLRFHATFEQRCENSTAALRGEIRIVADPWR